MVFLNQIKNLKISQLTTDLTYDIILIEGEIMATLILDSYQTTAYWWVKQIQSTCKEINNTESSKELSKAQTDFARFFNSFETEDWRKLYVKLTEKIKLAVTTSKKQSFKQCTKKEKHNKLNSMISQITNYEIPDINILSKYGKGYIIETTPKQVTQTFANFDQFRVSECYEDNAILSDRTKPNNEQNLNK